MLKIPNVLDDEFLQPCRKYTRCWKPNSGEVKRQVDLVVSRFCTKNAGYKRRQTDYPYFSNGNTRTTNELRGFIFLNGSR